MLSRNRIKSVKYRHGACVDGDDDCLEQSLGFTHGRLDVERPDVLPLVDVSSVRFIREP